MNKTKINRKPGTLKTRNIFAECRVDSRGKVVVSIFDRGHWLEEGCAIPTNDELEKLANWVKRVRAYSRFRQSKKS